LKEKLEEQKQPEKEEEKTDTFKYAS